MLGPSRPAEIWPGAAGGSNSLWLYYYSYVGIFPQSLLELPRAHTREFAITFVGQPARHIIRELFLLADVKAKLAVSFGERGQAGRNEGRNERMAKERHLQLEDQGVTENITLYNAKTLWKRTEKFACTNYALSSWLARRSTFV